MSPFCSQCGFSLKPADKFCPECGAKTPSLSAGESPFRWRAVLVTAIPLVLVFGLVASVFFAKGRDKSGNERIPSAPPSITGEGEPQENTRQKQETGLETALAKQEQPALQSGASLFLKGGEFDSPAPWEGPVPEIFSEKLEKQADTLMIEFTARIDAPIEDVFRAFAEPERGPEFSETVRFAQLLQHVGHRKVVEFEMVILGQVQRTTLEFRFLPAEKRVLVNSVANPLAEVAGEYRFATSPDGAKTLLTYTGTSQDKAKLPVPLALQKSAVRESFVSTVQTLKKQVVAQRSIASEPQPPADLSKETASVWTCVHRVDSQLSKGRWADVYYGMETRVDGKQLTVNVTEKWQTLSLTEKEALVQEVIAAWVRNGQTLGLLESAKELEGATFQQLPSKQSVATWKPASGPLISG